MSTTDWILFLGMPLALVTVGWYSRRYMHSVSDFVVAGRQVRKYLGLSSWSVEGIGLISIVYLTEQGFRNGFGYIWMMLLGMAVQLPLFGILGFGIRRFRATRAQTIPQFHEMRFSRGVRVAVGLALAVGGILNMAVFPSISSRFLVAFLGLPSTLIILGQSLNTVHVCMVGLILPALLIAMSGGAVGVIVTDYLESVVLACFMFLTTGLVLFHVGLHRMTDVLQHDVGSAAFNPFLSGGYGPVWVAFFILSGVLAPLTFPPSMAKFASTDSPDTTRKMALIGSVFSSGRVAMILLWGVGALAAVAATGGSHLHDVQYARYATATFLRGIMPVGFRGLSAGALLFAYVAVDKNYYLAWSAIIVNDIIRPLQRRPLSQTAQVTYLRGSMVLIAVFIFCWGLVYDPLESVLSYIYLTGAIFTAAGIITLVGLYWKRANSWGAYLTVGICFVLPVADLVGKRLIGAAYPLSSEQSGLAALLLSGAAFFFAGAVSRRGEQRWVDYSALAKLQDAAVIGRRGQDSV